MKSLAIIGIIVVLFFLVDTIEPVFGVISYPANHQRLQDIPTYCIVKPSGLTTTQTASLVNSGITGVNAWSSQLKNIKSTNPDVWTINTKTISSSESTSGCDITIYFKETVRQLHDDESITTVGLFSPSTQSIQIAYKGWNLGKIYNIMLHEIGHSFGLGHYVSDDNEENKKFYSGTTQAPSIMVPITHNNPDLVSITSVDISKVFSLYGSKGFYALSTEIIPTPLFPTTPTNPISPIIPVKPFESIQISNDKIITSKYDTSYVKITGQIHEEVYRKGFPVYINVKNPDTGFTTYKIRTTSTGYFELPLVFDGKSQKGWYKVEASYFEHTDYEMDFNFKVVSEFSQNQLPKTKNFSFPEPKTSGNNSKYGKYFDDISIKVIGDKYTVTSKLNTNLPSKQIRITAENECPFKKQVYEKDFRSSMGAKTSFSFYQLSHGKPTNCSIHFTITDFEGRLLDSTKADYNSQTKKQITSNVKTETTKFVNNENNNPIFSTDQKQKMTKKIDTASVSILKLKDGLNVSKNSLYDADKKYTNSESKNHVEKAWQVYNKLNDKRINSMNALNVIVETYLNLENKQKTSNWNYYNQYTNNLKTINSAITSIGNDMKYISQELDYAEKVQNEEKSKQAKQCSWFWC